MKVKYLNYFKIIDYYDANYFWKNDIIFNHEILRSFLVENFIYQDKVNFLLNLDLNKLYNFICHEVFKTSITNLFKKNKKFRIKFDAFGVDKFVNKKKMHENFQVEIKYTFE